MPTYDYSCLSCGKKFSVHITIGDQVDLSDLDGRRSAVYAEAARRMEAAVRELYEQI